MFTKLIIYAIAVFLSVLLTPKLVYDGIKSSHYGHYIGTLINQKPVAKFNPELHYKQDTYYYAHGYRQDVHDVNQDRPNDMKAMLNWDLTSQELIKRANEGSGNGTGLNTTTIDNITNTTNTLEFVNGAQMNLTGFIPFGYADSPKTATNGFKVLDFIQACYTPSTLAICGVNSPVYYLMDVQIGTPPQPLQALLDFNNFESFFSTCNHLTDCPISKSENFFTCMYNSFDGNISFSFNYDKNEYQNNFIESGNSGNYSGCWAWDNVTFGSVGSDYERVVTDYFEFPMVNPKADHSFIQGLVGLGLEALQVNKTSAHNNSLLESLSLYGEVQLKVYSTYVDSEGHGKLLLGAIDTARINGNLTYFYDLPMKKFTTYLVNLGNDKFDVQRPFININYVNMGGLTNFFKKTNAYGTYDAVIESTERYIYAPKGFMGPIAKKYKLKTSGGRYFMPCDTLGDPLQLTLSQGLNITIPWSELVFKNLDPSTNTKKGQDCIFGMNYENKQDYWVLGQAFINNAYMYVDIEKNLYGLGAVNRQVGLNQSIHVIQRR